MSGSSVPVEIAPEIARKLSELREPFAAEYVAYRPQPYCKACSDSQYKVCDKHRRVQCQRCKQNVTNAHIDLAYIGHAETTDRLLKSDPEWSWEPLHRDIDPHVLAAAATSGNPDVVKAVIESAPPKLDQYGGLWIRLTVHGVTRLGYGDAQGKKPGPNAIKEIIGDAIRNAAMRFGVGIDLWSKSDMGELEAARMADRDAVETSPSAPPPNVIEGGHPGRGDIASAQNGHHPNGNGHAPNGRSRQYRQEAQDWFAFMQNQINNAADSATLDNLLTIAGEGCQQHQCPEVLPQMTAHIDQRRAQLAAPVDEQTLRSMHITLTNRGGLKTSEDRRGAISRIVGYNVETSKALTLAEVLAVLAEVENAPKGLDLVTGVYVPDGAGVPIGEPRLGQPFNPAAA